MASLPKLCGGDIELANFVIGLDRPYGSGAYAAQALLRQFDAVSAGQISGWKADDWGIYTQQHSTPYWSRSNSSMSSYGEEDSGWGGYGSTGTYNPQDIGRRFLPSNGGCVYEDLTHLELCLPEVISAWDWVACWHAMLRLTREAQVAANELQAPDRQIQVLANNSDGLSHSFGGHINLLVTREVYEALMHRRLHYLAYLVAFQVSSIVFTGQGKVGSENGAPPVAFQLTQRGDFFETILGQQTTYNRPLVNSRDEPLCGGANEPSVAPGGSLSVPAARLHSIFADTTLCHRSSLLRVGTMQIVLCMLEAGRLDVDLQLDDPLESLSRWGHDPSLTSRAPLTSGQKVTAVELQQRFHEQASLFVEDGGCDGCVPRAKEIVSLWGDTLERLRDGNLPSLVGKLDWVTKQALLREAIRGAPNLEWDSAEVKYLDHLYSSLPDGLFFELERDNLIDRVVSEEEVQRFTHSPPEDTRAWGRSLLLRMGGPDAISGVDWNMIHFRNPKRRWGQAGRVRVEMPNPLGWTREAMEPVVGRATGLEELLEEVGKEDYPRGGSTRQERGVSPGTRLLGRPSRGSGAVGG